jgi:hypothetical protein
MKKKYLLISLAAFVFFVSCKSDEAQKENSGNSTTGKKGEKIAIGNLSDSFSILHANEVLCTAGYDSSFVEPVQEYKDSEKTPIKTKSDIYKYFPVYKFYVPESEYHAYELLGEGNDYYIKEEECAFMNINGHDIKFIVTKGELPSAELLSKNKLVELISNEGKYRLKAYFSDHNPDLKLELYDQDEKLLTTTNLTYKIGQD